MTKNIYITERYIAESVLDDIKQNGTDFFNGYAKMYAENALNVCLTDEVAEKIDNVVKNILEDARNYRDLICELDDENAYMTISYNYETGKVEFIESN